MNLCIDQGNSSTKVGVFNDDELIETFVFEQFDRSEILTLVERFPISHCIISSVVSDNEELIKKFPKRYQHIDTMQQWLKEQGV